MSMTIEKGKNRALREWSRTGLERSGCLIVVTPVVIYQQHLGWLAPLMNEEPIFLLKVVCSRVKSGP